MGNFNSLKPRLAIVLGARPHFIKASVLLESLGRSFDLVVIHTGQHYDYWMYQQFLDELPLATPDYSLGVGSNSAGIQVGQTIAALDPILRHEAPKATVVIGDTNSSLSGALASVKLEIPTIHIEAGARLNTIEEPEELNRRIIDTASELLLCPTDLAASNLVREGHPPVNIAVVGDLLMEAAERFRSRKPHDLPVVPTSYALLTVHRRSNVTHPELLANIVEACLSLEKPVVWPLHPGTRAALEAAGLIENILLSQSFIIIPPVSYLQMLQLEIGAYCILTDSNGVQREAYYLRKPCVILRNDTEYPESVADGYASLAGANVRDILEAYARLTSIDDKLQVAAIHSGERSSELICKRIEESFGEGV